MRRIMLAALFLMSGSFLVATSVKAQERLQAAPGSGWSAPVIVYPETWPDPLHFSVSDDGARLVALISNSGSDDNSRHIVVSELRGGVWQAPVVIAQNGAHSEAPLQFLPQSTHPVISGDGQTIAYVGYTGSTFGIYVLGRTSDGAWGAATLVNTGFANTHYWISLSRNGNTLAVSDYPFLGMQHLYVLARTAGVWSAPVRVSADSMPNPGGGMPSLSEDGSRLAFIANARVMASQRTLDGWTAPVSVTTNNGLEASAEFPQMSGDGMSITYWLVTLVPDGGVYVRTAQNLYMVRWNGGAWGAAAQVNSTPVLPSSLTEGPATANRYTTRIVYTRPVTSTDPGSDTSYVSGSHLDVSEWITGTWQTTRLVEMNGFNNMNKWPRLTPLGKTLIFDGGIRYQDGAAVNGALWQMTTEAAPPLPPYALSITTLLGQNGGSLFSAFDNIRYLFGTGTFSDTVEFTHSFFANLLAPPDGTMGIGGIGGLDGLGGAFTSTLLGPGGLPIQPNLPVTVTVDYSNTNTGTVIPGSLNLWWLNSGQWVKLPSVDDPASRVMTATVSHLSQFAVFGETKRIYLPCVIR